MRQLKMQISTQTDNQNQRQKCCNQWKLHSKKNGLKISKTQQHFMQISVLEQVKVDD